MHLFLCTHTQFVFCSTLSLGMSPDRFLTSNHSTVTAPWDFSQKMKFQHMFSVTFISTMAASYSFSEQGEEVSPSTVHKCVADSGGVDFTQISTQLLRMAHISMCVCVLVPESAYVCLTGMETIQLSHSVKSLYTFGSCCWQVIQSSEGWTSCQEQSCLEYKRWIGKEERCAAWVFV